MKDEGWIPELSLDEGWIPELSLDAGERMDPLILFPQPEPDPFPFLPKIS